MIICKEHLRSRIVYLRGFSAHAFYFCLLKTASSQNSLLAVTTSKQNLSPNWGERGLTRFHPDLCQATPAHLLGPLTGSSVHLNRLAGLSTCLINQPFRISLAGGFLWFRLEGDSQTVISHLWRTFPSYSSRSTRLLRFCELYYAFNASQEAPSLNSGMPPACHPGWE